MKVHTVTKYRCYIMHLNRIRHPQDRGKKEMLKQTKEHARDYDILKGTTSEKMKTHQVWFVFLLQNVGKIKSSQFQRGEKAIRIVKMIMLLKKSLLQLPLLNKPCFSVTHRACIMQMNAWNWIFRGHRCLRRQDTTHICVIALTLSQIVSICFW